MRTPDGKVVLFHTSTGEQRDHWPVDAREILAFPGTEWTAELPDGFVAPPAPEPTTVGLPVKPALHPLGMPAITTHARDVAPAQLLGTEPKRTRGKA